MITINTHFTPFRLKLSRWEPVQLFIEIINDGDEEALLTLSIDLSKQLSFEKGGYTTEDVKRISSLAAGEKKHFYYEIWPKASTRLEKQPIKMKVSEHYRNFDYVVRTQERNLTLAVEK